MSKVKEAALQEVVEMVEPKDLVPQPPSDGLDFLQELAGVGMDYSQDELALPFLKIVSGLDPILDDENVNARKGDILNTVTNKVYKGKEGITVIPCGYQRRWIEWAPRGQGSGAPINIYTLQNQVPATTRSQDDNREYLPNGNYIEETHQHFVLVIEPDGTFEMALIAMKSTQLKKSRKWNTMIRSRTIIGSNGVPFPSPVFGFHYRLATVEESNSKGSWHGWTFSVGDRVSCTSTLKTALEFHKSVKADEVVVKHEAAESEATPKTVVAQAEKPVEDDDLPF